MVNHEQFKSLLVSMQKDLTERLDRIKHDVTRKASADWSEQAQERENDEVIDALGNEATIELSKINKALERIHDGTFGSCSACANKITDGRLQAMPYADLCIGCAESPNH